VWPHKYHQSLQHLIFADSMSICSGICKVFLTWHLKFSRTDIVNLNHDITHLHYPSSSAVYGRRVAVLESPVFTAFSWRLHLSNFLSINSNLKNDGTYPIKLIVSFRNPYFLLQLFFILPEWNSSVEARFSKQNPPRLGVNAPAHGEPALGHDGCSDVLIQALQRERRVGVLGRLPCDLDQVLDHDQRRGIHEHLHLGFVQCTVVVGGAQIVK
jgi:hypothetical protein